MNEASGNNAGGSGIGSSFNNDGGSGGVSSGDNDSDHQPHQQLNNGKDQSGDSGSIESGEIRLQLPAISSYG